jgi:hypothetical protein
MPFHACATTITVYEGELKRTVEIWGKVHEVKSAPPSTVAESDESYLYGLCRFITARMIHHLHLQDFILGHLDLLNGTMLGGLPVTPRSSFKVPSLRRMRSVKCFSTYFIEVLEEARQSREGNRASASFGGR